MNRLKTQSDSSVGRTRNYQVFVSFRGEDTRLGFTGHLYDALQRRGMLMCTDMDIFERGVPIESRIKEAIDKSRICFVVFSRNYASSRWCLNELVIIAEKITEPEYTVLPIFYDVDPSDVRYQKGNFGSAFAKHEKMFSSDSELVRKWRTAMTDVTSLAGWDVRDRFESQVIDDIVEFVVSKLGHKSSDLADDLVGVESRVEALENLLDLDSKDVRFVGICGMGGIGKTTLAAVLHDRYSHLFDCSCFLADVSKVSKASGLVRLQKQLLSETLGKELKIWDERQGTNLISTKLGHLKILIVVDDVDDLEQLEKLAGKSVRFGKGSRIIVTTRDKRILRAHDINRVHEVELLNHDEALQLLCRKAFKSDNPLAESKDIIVWAVEYANGLPLAIKALAWVLFGLDESEWSDAMATLKENPLEKVMEVLQTSFDSLEKEEKEIFLDIACFFEGAEENYVMEILDHCGYYPAVGVRVLFDKSLIGIVNGTFKMHKFLQQLGWKIARANSPKDQTNWSRLWLYDDFQHILQTNRKLLNLRSVDLRYSENVTVMPDFSRIPNLERLDLEGCSGLLQLDQSISILRKLKVLNLKKCINLVSIPNSLFGLSSLKFLNLAGCSKLAECLDFDNWRTSVEVKVLSNEDVPLREVLSYNVLSKFPEKIRPEAKVIDDIVETALSILSRKFLSVDLVGMQSHVEAFEKILDIVSDGGGLGKMILASLLYDKISHQFERSYFLSNVSELSGHLGLDAVQAQILYAMIKEKDAVVGGSRSLYQHRRLRRLKVLLVIDSVNDLELLEHLNIRQFGVGSRVIITTRNEHVLKSFGVDGIYRVESISI